MSLILTKSPGNFIPHPKTENPVRATIVDITPVKSVEKTDKKTNEKYTKNVFRIVYETEVLDDEGKRFCVWSRQYAADGRDPLNEKANLRIDIKKILGRDLTAAELEAFDVEATLLFRTVRLMVDHEIDGDKTYDTITMLQDWSKEPLAASGAYIRQKDRKKEGDAQYSAASSAPSKPAPSSASTPAASAGPATTAAAPSAAGAAAAAPTGWENTKVHLDGYNGLALSDLDMTTLEKLANVELPALEAKEKKTIADKRLIAALIELKKELAA